MNLLELKRDLQQLENLEKRDLDSFEILSMSDYYDGMLAGLLRANKEIHWYEIINREILGSETSETKRKYAIIELNSEELLKERRIQIDFLKYVGNFGIMKPFRTPWKYWRKNKSKFYDKHSVYIESRPYERNKILAWFED